MSTVKLLGSENVELQVTSVTYFGAFLLSIALGSAYTDTNSVCKLEIYFDSSF